MLNHSHAGRRDRDRLDGRGSDRKPGRAGGRVDGH